MVKQLFEAIADVKYKHKKAAQSERLFLCLMKRALIQFADKWNFFQDGCTD